MNLTIVNGWLDDQIGKANPVYVATSGNDKTGRGTQTQPYGTIKKALSVPGATGVFIRGGDIFSEFVTLPKGGVDSKSPFVIGSYGAGRATLRNLYVQNKNWLVFRDLILAGPNTDLVWLYGCSGVWIEGCLIGGGNVGITTQCYEKQTTDHTYRRNVIRRIAPKLGNPAMRSQGMFVHNVKGVRIIENLFDHCGWLDVSDASTENHGLYCYANCEDVTVEGNTFNNCSATGAQMRAGGLGQRNLFLNNPIGLTYGLVNGAGEQHPGGCIGEVRWNVIIGNRNINAQNPRGNGMAIGANIRKADVSENLIMDDQTGVDDAFVLEVGRGSFAGDQVGYVDLIVQNNRIYNWTKGARAVVGNYPRNIRLVNNFGFEPFENVNLVTVVSVDNKGLPVPKRLSDYVAAIGQSGPFEGLLAKMDGSRSKWDPALVGGMVCDWLLNSAGIKTSTSGPVTPIPIQQYKVTLSVWPGGTELTEGSSIAWPADGNIKASFDSLPKKVQFWLDGKPIGSQSFSPFFVFGDSGGAPLPGPVIPPGQHTLKVQGDGDPVPLLLNFSVLGPVPPTPMELVSKIRDSVMGGQNQDAIDQCNTLIKMLTPTIPS